MVVVSYLRRVPHEEEAPKGGFRLRVETWRRALVKPGCKAPGHPVKKIAGRKDPQATEAAIFTTNY